MSSLLLETKVFCWISSLAGHWRQTLLLNPHLTSRHARKPCHV